MPATYVAGSDGVIGYAFADADWTRRAEPADIVGCGRAPRHRLSRWESTPPSRRRQMGASRAEGHEAAGRIGRDQQNLLQVLGPVDREALAAAIDRLRMLQLVEQGLAVGDVLPDFTLPDVGGRIVTSDELLPRGPVALAFFRGPWCPYCSLTLEALK